METHEKPRLHAEKAVKREKCEEEADDREHVFEKRIRFLFLKTRANEGGKE
jgi:hypothetical protein